jgi:hypothetical protein
MESARMILDIKPSKQEFLHHLLVLGLSQHRQAKNGRK